MEISVPTHMTDSKLKKEWKNLISRSELSLGEPCCPTVITRQTIKNGILHNEEATAYGRKCPLLNVKEKLLENYEKFMYLHTDKDLNEMNESIITSRPSKKLFTTYTRKLGLRENIIKT